jgi:hypothetical protein
MALLSEATLDDRLFYQQIFPHEILAVQHGYSSPAFPLCGHLHKGNTPWLAGLFVLDNLDRHDVPGFGEKGFDLNFSGLEREVGYVNFLIHIFPTKKPAKKSFRVLAGMNCQPKRLFATFT